jgi:hypothetical protein
MTIGPFSPAEGVAIRERFSTIPIPKRGNSGVPIDVMA